FFAAEPDMGNLLLSAPASRSGRKGRSPLFLVMRVLFLVTLAGGGRLLCGSGPLRRRAIGRGLAAFLATLMGCGMAGILAAAGAGLLAAAIVLVDGGPGTAFGLLVAHALFLVAFLDMLGLALLL